MFGHRVLLALCFPLGLVFALGCGEYGGESPVVDSGEVLLSPPPSWVYTPGPTATQWPTFTPVPTPTLTPTPMVVPTRVPTSTLFPTSTPILSPEPPVSTLAVVPTPFVEGATVVPQPVETPPAVVETPEVEVELTPSPTPYGKVWNHDFFFWQQSLFPLQSSVVPDYLNNREWEKLPRPAEFISRSTRYVIWVVVFDGSQADPDFVMNGFVRWTQLPPVGDSLVMLENPVELSPTFPFFYAGLGTDTPGFWMIGSYRVDLLDDRYEPVVGWTFEVR